MAVASGFSTLAVGTDTIGSLITPANRAALYALKPTVGQVPMDGIFNLSKTFDAVGGMVRNLKLTAWDIRSDLSDRRNLQKI